MVKRKPKAKAKKIISGNRQASNDDINPRNAKFVLFVFGIGPLILMILFLASKGFFNG